MDLYYDASRAALSSDGFFRRVAGNDEASWRLRWVKRQKGQRRIYYAFDDYHPSRGWTLRPGLRGVQAAQTQQPGLQSSGLRKRTKVMIAIASAAAFASIAYSIDRNVVNSTPSCSASVVAAPSSGCGDGDSPAAATSASERTGSSQ